MYASVDRYIYIVLFSILDCVDYNTVVAKLQQELVSTQRFVDGLVFAFTSEPLVCPLLHAILPGLLPGILGFINLQVSYIIR